MFSSSANGPLYSQTPAAQDQTRFSRHSPTTQMQADARQQIPSHTKPPGHGGQDHQSTAPLRGFVPSCELILAPARGKPEAGPDFS